MTAVVLNNRYRVVRELGHGGFGQTFLAVDTHVPSERYCVIKQLYPVVSKPKQYQWIRERFQREAAILESLSRGNSQIPQLYAYFAESETFYLVQEYIEGLTLTEKVEKSGVLSEKQVTKIVISLLKVLDYVHSQHIIHRDVKPDNVILRTQDQQPVLIDFGVVKEALGTVMDSERTHSIAIGTPGYMPSEQAAGRPVYSSDLYSLALTAIFLLSGQPPHTIESDPRSGELLWRKAVPHLHGNLAGVIDRALRFNPRDRFEDAQEMLGALTDSGQYTTENQSSPTTQLQSPRTEAATVAATPYRYKPQPQPQPEERKGNSFLMGVAIVILIIASAGGIGYGMVQVLEGLRQGNNNETVVNEPNSSDQSSTDEENDSSGQERETQEDTPQSRDSEIAQEEVEPKPNSKPEPEIELEVDSPAVVVPTTPVEPDSTPERPIAQVRVFSTGATKAEVIETLGEPTSSRRGYWANTQTILYKDYVSGKLDLGYIFDRDTQNLRQTEASFASSVELSIIESKLETMLKGNLTPVIRQGLEEVYRKETDLRSFTIEDWKGIIQRNDQGRIYIGVWEQDLH